MHTDPPLHRIQSSIRTINIPSDSSPPIRRSRHGNTSSRYLLLGQRSKRKMTQQPADVLIPPPNGVFSADPCTSGNDRDRGTLIYFDPPVGAGENEIHPTFSLLSAYPLLSSVDGTPTRGLHWAAQQRPCSIEEEGLELHETTGDSRPPRPPDFPTFPGVPVSRLTTTSVVSLSAPANLLPLPFPFRGARSFAYHRVAAPAVNPSAPPT